MKIAFITGITGQDGSYLVELLLEKQYKVYGMIRRMSTINTTRIDHILNKINLRYGDVTDTSNIVGILSEIKNTNSNIERLEIYNLAAQSHVKISFEMPEFTANTDALGVLRILEAIRICELNNITRFYQAGTSEMYGLVQSKPQNEKTPFYPRSPYGVAKLFGYWITKNYREAYNMYACTGILFNHESPRRGENFVTRKITIGLGKILRGESENIILGNLNSLRDWGHAKDYVKAMWLMLQQEKPEDYVLATGVSKSVNDLIDYVFNKLDLNREKYVKTDKKFERAEELNYLRGDANKAITKLGWKYEYTFESMIDEMINYWLEKLKK
jgi:GDPmannose 4,6-dehydratase